MNFQPISKDHTPSTVFLKISDENNVVREVAYQKLEGKSPGVVFIPGFMAKKEDKKPAVLMNYCLHHGIQFIRYDTTGLGESIKTISRKEARFKHWLEDAEQILLKLTKGPQIVVGGSMGSWISLILAEKYPEKFLSLLLTSPAINFGSEMMERLSSKPPEVLELLERGEVLDHMHEEYPEYGPMPISYGLFKGMIPYELNFEEDKLNVNCPIRILHGMKDSDVPYLKSTHIVTAVKSKDVTLTYIKMAKHELVEDLSIACLMKTFIELVSLADSEDSITKVIQ